MKSQSFEITPENPACADSIETLTAETFGPGRFARTAFRLRENIPHEPELSLTAQNNGELVGSVRLTRILIGDQISLLLGPLVVSPKHKNIGIGAALMEASVKTAKDRGWQDILLVGDLTYYEKFGFKVVPHGKITMPGPVDPARLLYCPLQNGGGCPEGVATKLSGESA